jgi:hypothetical protein
VRGSRLNGEVILQGKEEEALGCYQALLGLHPWLGAAYGGRVGSPRRCC